MNLFTYNSVLAREKCAISDLPGWIKPTAKAERSIYFSQEPFEFEGFLPEHDKSFWTIVAFLCKEHTNAMPDIHHSPYKARIFSCFNWERCLSGLQTPCSLLNSQGYKMTNDLTTKQAQAYRTWAIFCSMLVKQPAHRNPVCTWQFWLY